jgi:hypothetical protein
MSYRTDEIASSSRSLESSSVPEEKSGLFRQSSYIGTRPRAVVLRRTISLEVFCLPPGGCSAQFFAETLTRRCRQQFVDRSMAGIDFSPRVQLRVPNPESRAGPRVVFLY